METIYESKYTRTQLDEGVGAGFVPTLQAAPTSSTTSYTRSDLLSGSHTVSFVVGQMCRVAVTGGYDFYQLKDVTSGTATWIKVEFTDTTYSVMGASGSGHASGLTPDTPSTAGTTKFLREDGTWQEPTIPTVNDATLTIQKNGTQVATFTANASSDVTANITVPTGDLASINKDGTSSTKYLRGDGTWQAFPTSLPANGGNSTTVNNHTVNSDVPANAVFTDTTYESKDAASGGSDVSLVTTGEKYTWNNKLSNKATGSSSLTVAGTATTTTGSTNVGVGTQCTANYATVMGHNAKGGASSVTAIGRSTNASGSFAVALGYGATCSGGKAIQIGYGTNSTATSFFVGFQDVANYQMLDGTTGLIPDARISSNIARTSAIPSYSAGTNISISNGTISAKGLPVSAGTATSLASLPVTNRLIVATISANQSSVSIANGVTALTAGCDLHVIVVATAAVTITLPTSSPYVNCSSDSSLSVASGGYAEINFVSDGTNIYVRAIS